MLEVASLNVELNVVPVLRNVSLRVERREFAALVGRNGAGKTTLLRALMGLVAVRRGSITLDGKNLTDLPSHGRAALEIGYMPEDRRLVPGLTSEENILLPALTAGGKETRAHLERIYGLIPELGPLRHRKAVFLSGGQQKLVALGRALMAGRRLLLLDEPTEGVAPALARRICEVLANLKHEGWSVFIAESNGKHIETLIDTRFVIERGALTRG